MQFESVGGSQREGGKGAKSEHLNAKLKSLNFIYGVDFGGVSKDFQSGQRRGWNCFQEELRQLGYIIGWREKQRETRRLLLSLQGVSEKMR